MMLRDGKVIPMYVEDIEFIAFENVGAGGGWGVWSVVVTFDDGTKRTGTIHGTRNKEGMQPLSEIRLD